MSIVYVKDGGCSNTHISVVNTSAYLQSHRRGHAHVIDQDIRHLVQHRQTLK